MNFLFVFLFIGLAAKNNSIDAATFRFPNQNEFKKDCILGNDSFPVGLCKKAKHCTSLSTSKKELNTCFFDRFEQFVCCDRNAVDKSYSTNDRKALKACGTYYPVWLEVTHALPTRPREFPYMCALGWQSRFNRNTFDYKCGGVLIESNFVITAAHCAYVNGVNRILMEYVYILCIAALTAPMFSVDAATFKYPPLDEFKSECNLTDGTFLNGICKKAKHCTTFLTSKTDLNTCYFERFEQYVCCDRNAVDSAPISAERKAEKACREFYPMWLQVTNGIPTKPREFPYMCALGWVSRLDRNTFDYRCGGVLIESNFVLTAAHCAYANGIAPVVVLPGGPNLTDSSARNYKIARIFVHPEYNPDSSYHDIAIIQTEELIDETKACLWSKFDLLTNTLTIVGYGDTKFAGQSSPQLLKAELQAISNQECGEFYEADFSRVNGIIKRQLCAKDPEALRDTCQGDSGGPLIMMEEINSKLIPQIVGVTSFGQGCAGGPPGVYTRISEYIDWIESIVWPSD